MSEADAACCPACGASVDLMRVALTSDLDRYICKNCNASIQNTSPADPGKFVWVMAGVLTLQLAKISPWLLLLLPMLLVAARARLKQRLPMTTFKLSEPWSLRS
jgi:hypothetical protein